MAPGQPRGAGLGQQKREKWKAAGVREGTREDGVSWAESKYETSESMCDRESEILRQRDKTGELMSDRGRGSVWGGETEGARGGNEAKEKVRVWIVSSEEFMSGVKTRL